MLAMFILLRSVLYDSLAMFAKFGLIVGLFWFVYIEEYGGPFHAGYVNFGLKMFLQPPLRSKANLTIKTIEWVWIIKFNFAEMARKSFDVVH